MKIKRLSIHGFKSFVDKVNLNFSSGTSAIIGPNGCGKSNIVDAIRWVIGEQNARHLRGRHMEDVIFNGSDLRKPLGMAEVALTFSNEDGGAPARFKDFTEIEIARRLYRSGESEYYLNKVQCRLKDVVEVFIDTGIGNRAYSIVEQGQVAWLINAKPEERRVIFEEAAGINKFKHKKEAALKRLESTRENLTRVNDIISEVKRQLNSLNRQAKKAERYRALKDEFKEIDLRLSAMDFMRASLAFEDIKKKITAAKDAELELQTIISSKEAGDEGLRLDYLKRENAYKGIREKVFGLERLVQSEEGANTLKLRRMEELDRNGIRLSEEIDGLVKENSAYAADMERLMASVAGYELECGATAKKAGELSSDLESVLRLIREKETDEAAESAESMKLSAKLFDVRHALITALKDEDVLREKEAKAVREREEVLSSLEATAPLVKALKERLLRLLDKKGDAEAGLDALTSRITALEHEKVRKEAGLKAGTDALSICSARLSTLEKMEQNLENVKAGARSVLLKKDLSGIHGLMADVIETNPGYEKAVEAVMGERLQCVIVESHREGLKAVEYLKSSLAGRGSFAPIRDLRPQTSPVPAGVFNMSGVKELINEVRIKDGYKELIQYLIGDTVVVDDLDAAIAVWKDTALYNKTIATRSGEIIDPQGVITGGAEESADAGILQRRGEIKELGQKAALLEKSVEGLLSGMSAVNAEALGLKKTLEELKESFHRTEIEKVSVEAELKRREDEIQRLEMLGLGLGREIADVGARLKATADKKRSLSIERNGLEAAVSESDERIKRIRKDLSALKDEKDGISNSLTVIKVSLAEGRERVLSLKREASEKERLISAASVKIDEKRLEIEAGRAEMEQRRVETEGIKTRIEALLKEIDGVRSFEAGLSEELTGLSERIRVAEVEIKGLKERVSELIELKGELVIEQKETELSLQNQVEKIIERYGVDLRVLRPLNEETQDSNALEALKEDLRQKITALGEVSLSALEEYNDLERRHQFLVDQQTDLDRSVEALHSAITRINRTTRERFKTAFDEINKKFQENFPRFFSGGRAELRLADEGDVLEAGIEIVAQPPGKRLQNIALLSGGEKALTATSLIFSIFLIKPSPFCLLDEVDAPLDDANIDRFNGFVKEMSAITQFLLITHNKRTMETADSLYGITMEEPGVSKIISVRF